MSFARFRQRLQELAPTPGPAWVVCDSIDSTNSLARRVARGFRDEGEVPVAAVFFAYHQSGGRGRGSHRWESPEGAGVYASLLLAEVPAENLAGLPLLAAVGLTRALEPMVASSVRLRWPNDLLVGKQKLGGILIEALSTGSAAASVVVGFGVNRSGSPPVPEATTLERERPADVVLPSLAEVAARCVRAVEHELTRLGDEGYAASAYAAASAHRNGELLVCRTPSGTVEGRFRGFDERGFLRLETPQGERSMAAGELILRAEAD